VKRLFIVIACAAAIAGCGGGAGFFPGAPGASGTSTPAPAAPTPTATPGVTATPTPTATPTSTPTPTPQPGPLTLGTTSIQFTATGQFQDVTITDPGYAGVYTPNSSNGAVATATIVAGPAVRVTAGVAGTSTVTVSDSLGHQSTINVGVTTTGGVIH
jgi:hypothetical protein